MMNRPRFADGRALGDSMNMVETPEESPERINDRNTGAQAKEKGGRFVPMAQNHEAFSRSVLQLQMERHQSDLMNAGQPKVVEIEIGYDQRRNRFR